MKEIPIFTAALDIKSPWYIKDVYFEEEGTEKVLHIFVDHKRLAKFKYESIDYSVYDHQERTWKHLNFFQHKCYLHAPVPRVRTIDGKVKLVQVPWANPGSSFTLLFEKNILNLVEGGMSASAVGKHLEVGGKRIFGVVRRYVGYGLATQPLEVVKEMSVDETSSKKGHNYLTILSDREAKKVVGVAVGKDKKAFADAVMDMEIRGADRNKVRSVTMDMSRSYISGVDELMPQAEIVFDRFHICSQLNSAVDEIRRTEQRQYDEIKKTRYLWLRNNSKLTEEQREKINYLGDTYPNLGTAYRLKELLKKIMDDAYLDKKITPLNNWIKLAWKSGLKPIRNFINMLRDHWYGVKSYFKRLATNAYAERINLKIQEIKRVAKGYRNIDNFRIMIYFHLGGLKLEPTIFD